MRRFTVDGRWYTVTTAADAFGVSPQLVRDRLNVHGEALEAEHLTRKVNYCPIGTGTPRKSIDAIKVGSWERANL